MAGETSAVEVLEMELPCRREALDDVRRFAQAFCATAGDPARAEDLAMATAELAENAVVHGSSSTMAVSVEVSRKRRRMSVCVTNSALPEEIIRLRGLVERMRQEPDPRRFFASLIFDPSRPGVGLARIQDEGGLDVAVRIRGRRVSIQASGVFSPPRPDASTASMTQEARAWIDCAGGASNLTVAYWVPSLEQRASGGLAGLIVRWQGGESSSTVDVGTVRDLVAAGARTDPSVGVAALIQMVVEGNS